MHHDLTSGRLRNDIHEFDIRIYFEDTDFSRVVYHANYVKFFERGRSEFLRHIGITHPELDALDPPLVFVVVELNIRYLKPAVLDDVVTVKTRPAAIKGASFHLEQWMERDSAVLARAQLHVAIIDNTGRPRRLPAEVLARFPKPTVG